MREYATEIMDNVLQVVNPPSEKFSYLNFYGPPRFADTAATLPGEKIIVEISLNDEKVI